MIENSKSAISKLNKVSVDNSEHYKWGDRAECAGWHLVKSVQLSVILETVPPESGEDTHFHQLAEQFFFVLSGEATMELGSHTVILCANEGLHVPAGVAHRLVNKGKVALVFTVTSTPPSHGDRQLVEF